MKYRSFAIRAATLCAALCAFALTAVGIASTTPAPTASAADGLASGTSLPTTTTAPAPDKAHLFNPNSGLCLNVVNGSIDPGARTEIYNCLDSPVERWVLNDQGQLYNPNSGLCLNTVNYDVKPSTPTEIWACNPKIALWSFNGKNLVHKQSGLCLNVFDYDIKPGTRTEIYFCNGNAAESWSWWQF